MKKIPLYIDSDVGVDDMVALSMLSDSKQFDIRGISVVNGVATLVKGVNNLNRLLTYLKISCPIFVGTNQKNQESTVQFPSIDRKRANALALLPKRLLPVKGTNPVFPLPTMTAQIQKEQLPITLFAIGPLTNVAVLLADRVVVSKIQSLTIMGGTLFARGIVPPNYTTEYNIRLDPNAANDVLNKNIPITLVPLDATRWVPTKPEDAKGRTKTMLDTLYQTMKRCKPATPEGKIVRSILLKNKRDFSNFYDPLAAAILIEPTLVTKSQNVCLSVSNSRNTLGQMTIEKNILKPSVRVIQNVSPYRFYRLLTTIVTCEEKRKLLR